jgi:ribonuclease J
MKNDTLKYRLHGGADEIGGNFIEVEYAGKRIFLDMGMPLTLPEDGPFAANRIERRSTAEMVTAGFLPDLPGLYSGEDKSILGIFLSHPHKDHFGYLKRAGGKIPLYMGEKARAILEATALFVKDYPTFNDNPPLPLRDRKSIKLGPFEITPYAADHSALDSYSLLIKAGGRSLFYSGDLRAHGRKGHLFEKLLRDLQPGIDHFLVEGTMMGREEDQPRREVDLANDFTRELTGSSGLALVNTSAHNTDRLETIYYSTLNSGRTLVMDNYSAFIYSAIGHNFLPGNDGRVRVFFPLRQAIKIKNEKSFETKLNPFNSRRIYANEIAATRGKFVMLFRESMTKDFGTTSRRYINPAALSGAVHIYSMWSGYWEKMERTKRFLDEHNVRNVHIHCSGHIYKQDLRRLLQAARPGCAVPIHTEAAQRSNFRDIYDKVMLVQKGEWQAI